MELDVPVPHPANRAEALHNITLIQDLIAQDLAARVDGDYSDLGTPAEPVIPSTNANTDLIVHVGGFGSFGLLGGAYAFTVHSSAGFYQSAGSYPDLTDRELETQGLIETLYELRDTPGRMTIYDASGWLADYLTGQIGLWRPEHYCHGYGMREEHIGWCYLLRALYEHRQAGIVSACVWVNPAIEYCERLAQLYYESGSTSVPDRAVVLDSFKDE